MKAACHSVHSPGVWAVPVDRMSVWDDPVVRPYGDPTHYRKNHQRQLHLSCFASLHLQTKILGRLFQRQLFKYLLEWMYTRSLEHHNKVYNPEWFLFPPTDRAASLSSSLQKRHTVDCFRGKSITVVSYAATGLRGKKNVLERCQKSVHHLIAGQCDARLRQWCSLFSAVQLPDTSTPCGLHEKQTRNTSPSATHAFLIRGSSVLHL